MPPVLARRPRRPRHYRWDAAHAGRHPLHRRCALQSWKRGYRQIHKFKQNRIFYRMFHSWFFAIFYQKASKSGFRVYLPPNPSISGIFFKFPNFANPRSYVVRQFMWQLVNSHSVDDNLVLFRLWWREIMLRSEKVYKYFVQDCITPPRLPMLVSYSCKQTARATLSSTLAQHPQKQVTHITYTSTLPTQHKLAQISYHFWNSV